LPLRHQGWLLVQFENLHNIFPMLIIRLVLRRIATN
jgi:hypothetical protein